jgi:hypothetical protein
MTANPTPGAPVPPDEMKTRWLLDCCSGSTFSITKCIDKAAAWGADEQFRLCMEWLLQRPMSAPAYCLALEMQSALRPDPQPSQPPDAIKE